MTNLLNYEGAEDWIYESFLKAKPFLEKNRDVFTRHPELTRRLLDDLQNPDEGIPTVLVTGSKGKGSTSHLISVLLRGLGYKVGLFTSPHLVHFTERIRVNGQAISAQDFLRLCRVVEPYADRIQAELKPHEYQGPIGLALAVAMLYFREQRVDYAVIEAGRGGRFDDTNVLQNDWAVISTIFQEHVDELGPSIEDIIWHKIGIVKEGTQAVIFNKQEDTVADYVKSVLSIDKSVYFYGQQFGTTYVHFDKRGTTFTVQTDLAQYSELSIPLLGAFQAYNTATAVKACEVILHDTLSKQIVQDVLSRASWPGRCEMISASPTVLVDGAINAASARYIEEIVKEARFQNVISIVGVPEDKDYEGVISVVSSFSTMVILSAPEQSHKSFPTNVLKIAKQYHDLCFQMSPLAEALAYAKTQKETDLILIVGTQTFIGNAKRLHRQDLFQL